MDKRDLMSTFLANLASLNLKPQERILVAVSGGPDSMALLHLFLRWNSERIGVFHLNHGFREEAEIDANFVLDYGKSKEVQVHLQACDILSYIEASGESKQQGARTIRYRLMEECAREHGYDRIALAHHGDDQAETMLMRLLRGSGLHGLGGIPAERGIFIRPLLSVFKADILHYCNNFDVPFLEDVTNLQPIYLRNKIRQELVPYLKREYNPQIVSQLIQLGELARADDEELAAQVDKICDDNVLFLAGQVVFPRKNFVVLSLALQRRVLRKLIQLQQGHLLQINFQHIEEWRLQLLQAGTCRLSLPGIEVSATQDAIYVGDFSPEDWERQILIVPGEVRVGRFLIRAELFPKNELPQPTMYSEDFDQADLVFPLEIRPRQRGDRLRPFGGAGTKKLKDLFIEARVPQEQRDTFPLICDQRGILWIPTVRRSVLSPLSEQTSAVVRLSYCHT